MELCDGCLQQKYKEFSQNEVRQICQQVILAIKEVHQRGVCHRDIKLQNIFYKIHPDRQELEIKIGDFRASKKIVSQSPMKSNIGTGYYKPLQMMKAEQYTQKVDSWAVGIVILELWSKKRVNQFYKGCMPALVDNFPSQADLSAIKDQALRNLTRKLLKKDPQERMLIVDAFRQLCFNQISQKQETSEEQTSSQNSEVSLSPEQKLKKSLLQAAKKQNWIELTTLPKLQLLQKQLQKLPLQIGTLTQLIQLDLFANELSYLPQSIGNLINLQKLTLSCNRLQKLPHTMSKLVNLTDLKLRDNKLTQFPQLILLFSQLDYLTISGNKFYVDPRWFVKSRNLNCLVIDKDQLQREQDVFLLKSSMGINGMILFWRGDLQRIWNQA